MSFGDFAATHTSMETPGPGSYDPDPIRVTGGPYSVKRAILDKHPDKAAVTQNIDYPPLSSSLNRNGKTIGGLCKRKNDGNGNPAPNYLPNPTQYFTRGFRIKGKYADPDTSKYPGPGQYSPADPTKTRIPPQGNRPPIQLSEQSESPGPAAYNIPDDFGNQSSKFTFRPRTALPESHEENPGFAYNNPGGFGSASRKSSFPKAQSPREQNSDNPGPGSYDPAESADRKIHYSLDRKGHDGGDLSTQRSTTAYGDRTRPATTGGGAGGRRASSALGGGAGGGSDGGTGRSRTIQTRQTARAPQPVPQYVDIRKFPEIKQKTIAPMYNSRGFWDAEPSNMTGPDYLPDSALGGKQITIGKRLPDRHGTETPGPSDYMPRDPRYQSERPFTVKGPSSRNDWLPTNQDLPGPGAYSIQQDTPPPRWSIGDKSFKEDRKRARTRAALLRQSSPMVGNKRKASTAMQ